MIDFVLKIGLSNMKRYMKKHNITDLTQYPDGPEALQHALFFLPKKVRKQLVEGLAMFASMM